MTIPVTTYNALWSRPGLVMAGIGSVQFMDPGTGHDRYQRALDALTASGKSRAFASFTFDPEQRGSVVVIPTETTNRFDTGPNPPGGVLNRHNDQEWRSLVEQALAAIAQGEVSKVVLARHLSARLNKTVDPFAVAAGLLKTQSDCHVFAVAGLVGASPELLLSLDNGTVKSTPLAGSAISDPTRLATSKAFEEHLIAANSVSEGLTRSGVRFTRDEPEVLDVGSIQHLATRFNGTVSHGTSFAEILAHLHPTAAVAGTPRLEAMNLIRRLEGDTRGRYSGPVGWFDASGNGEFALALRCGLIDYDSVTLHSGAGIVAGSEPGEELEETVWKLEPMMTALNLSDGP